MNSKLLRHSLNALGVLLVIAWLVGAFLVEWHGWFGVAAAAAFLTAGYMQFCEKMRDLHGLDDHWRTTPREQPPVTSEIVHTPPQAFTVIDGGQDPDWHRDHWQQEHRPTWDTDIFGAPD